MTYGNQEARHRLFLMITHSEWVVLAKLAVESERSPREQATWMLKQLLKQERERQEAGG